MHLQSLYHYFSSCFIIFKMNEFEEYLLKEYHDSNVVCTAFKYSHSAKEKIDKASKVPIINNTINVKIDSYDDKHNLIASHSEKFENGEIKRSKKNKLINIAPAELNNRFGAAKQQIANRIMHEYLLKLEDINQKIESLRSYVHCDGIIPNEFVNEPAIGELDKSNQKQFEF